MADTYMQPYWHTRYLDALRGIAVLLVVAVHTGLTCDLSPGWMSIALSGQRGVQLFFLVSAFTLTLSNDKRAKVEPKPVRNFFIRRFFRLVPLFYLDILLTARLSRAILGRPLAWILGIFFLQGLNPDATIHVVPGGWTLGVEAMFYVCLPLLLRRIRSLRTACLYLLIAAPLLTLVSRFLNNQTHKLYNEYFTFLWFPIELPVFLMGITVYFFWKERISPYSWSKRKSRLASGLLIVASAAIYCLNIPLQSNRLYFSTFGYVCLMFALAIHPWPLLVNRLTVFLGKISFSIYLLHYWLLQRVVGFTLPGPATHPAPLFLRRYVLTVVTTGLVSTLTWFYIEEKGIRLGRRFIAWLDDRHAVRGKIASLQEEWETGRPSKSEEQF